MLVHNGHRVYSDRLLDVISISSYLSKKTASNPSGKKYHLVFSTYLHDSESDCLVERELFKFHLGDMSESKCIEFRNQVLTSWEDPHCQVLYLEGLMAYM